MRKERVEYLVDSFVDTKGDLRHFVIVAISEVFTESDEPSFIADRDGFEIHEVAKGLKLGFSICNPIDTFNEKMGIEIAIGRARKNSEYAILASEPGYINSKLVKALLEQEAEYFKRNPEYRIKGYKRK